MILICMMTALDQPFLYDLRRPVLYILAWSIIHNVFCYMPTKVFHWHTYIRLVTADQSRIVSTQFSVGSKLYILPQ